MANVEAPTVNLARVISEDENNILYFMSSQYLSLWQKDITATEAVDIESDQYLYLPFLINTQETSIQKHLKYVTSTLHV